ncbi:type II secretion system minor pseudopilin GspH [Parendozoicomonas haliclonae]|uniref:type II secretion system minor pseudopilin GspH n=1 Tax=Parendozoicomonas haliclonae TaxID=1960125 RepID=UPI001F61926F|nr:type II secretion system minor pseudopilin GspH [Parendozoicomonas haliclonae]
MHFFRRVPQQGFTLLEILLVLLLIGLAGSYVVGSVLPKDSRRQTETQAEQFAAVAALARSEALVSGRDYGIRLTQYGYSFVFYRSGEWQDVDKIRTLQSRDMPDGLQLSFKPGESVWQESLAQEEKSEDRETDIENKPDIYLWSSGEISPGQVSIQASGHTLLVVLTEMGNIRVQDPRVAEMES